MVIDGIIDFFGGICMLWMCEFIFEVFGVRMVQSCGGCEFVCFGVFCFDDFD